MTHSAMARPTRLNAANRTPSRSSAWFTRCLKVQNRLPRYVSTVAAMIDSPLETIGPIPTAPCR